jgi:hypothetical protein
MCGPDIIFEMKFDFPFFEGGFGIKEVDWLFVFNLWWFVTWAGSKLIPTKFPS